MKHFLKLALLIVLFVGCTTPGKEIASNQDPVPVEPPPTNWTKGELSTDGAPTKGEFTVKFLTTAGDFTMHVHRDWSPRGAERFYQLIKNRYYDGAPFYRVLPKFIVQFGMCGDAKGSDYWDQTFLDEPVVKSNTFGTVSYAKASENTRSTQLFINYNDNTGSLDSQGFAAFAEVVEGMSSVININAEYTDKPKQPSLKLSGSKYTAKRFPRIDYIIRTTMTEGPPQIEQAKVDDE
ncbi:MAG: peptidyl-prolyl cis-trans isomerase A (cyclophilin A) [Mariniblastus sp.]|jgi:peptidyl-prolyl cis-trans isomerase A (cyclophilin A)